jgi:hypothetical protein
MNVILAVTALLLSFPVTGAAQAQGASTAQTVPSAQREVAGINPWDDRPDCASMFLKTDWKLSQKQRACAWLRDGVFSNNAIFGAVFSARFSQDVDLTSERGDGFATRFGRKFGQSAIKNTAVYFGSLLSREDPRGTQPFLIMRGPTPARGFWGRLGAAIAGNVVGTYCSANAEDKKKADAEQRRVELGDCTHRDHIKQTFAASRLAGSIASGFAGELLTHDRPDSLNHALRGSASAYAATFGSAIVSEFRPELSAFAGRLFRGMGGSR